jgi:hypothetical protein
MSAPAPRRFGTMYWLWIIGWVFFGAGGGATFRWRDIPVLGRVFVLLGAAFIAFGLVWPVVYKEPWIDRLAEGVAAVASVLAILVSWAYYRAVTEESRTS